MGRRVTSSSKATVQSAVIASDKIVRRKRLDINDLIPNVEVGGYYPRTMRFPPELFNRLSQEASHRKMSLNGLVMFALSQFEFPKKK